MNKIDVIVYRLAFFLNAAADTAISLLAGMKHSHSALCASFKVCAR